MGHGFYSEKVGTIYGRISSCEYERVRRGLGGMPYMFVHYWAEIIDDRDVQRSLVNCAHNHREPEHAMPCLRRLLKVAIALAQPHPVGNYGAKALLEPDEIRGAIKIVLSRQSIRRRA